MQQPRNLFVDGFNYYVPRMQAGADLGQLLRQRVSFGAPVLADPDGILDGISIADAVDTTTFQSTYSSDVMGPYGRTVTVVASGAATSAVTVFGRDYLGQPVKETLTLNGTSAVAGVKAFKYVDRIQAASTAATTIDLGFGARFGLPYKTRAVEREFVDHVLAAAGTLVQPSTVTATATSSDPRGLYTPTTTPDGVKLIEIDAVYDNSLNASNEGGLHGVRHFAG